MSATSVYDRVGLARNPFCHDVVGDTYVERSIGEPPLPRGRRFVQVIGPKGAGKSTLLARWRGLHPGPHRWVPPGRARWRPLPVAAIAFWDEVDRAPGGVLWHGLRRAARAGATVVVGTHTDLSRVAQGAGLDVHTHELAPLQADDVGRWAAARLAASSSPGAACELVVDPQLAERVAASSGASWRRAGELLHVWVAEQVAGAGRRPIEEGW